MSLRNTFVVGLGIAALCSALALAQPKADESAPVPIKPEYGWCDWHKSLQEDDCRTKDADYAACLKQAEKRYEACVQKYGK